MKKISSAWHNFREFLPFLLPYWRIRAITIFLSAILVPLGLVAPYLAKLVIDKAYTNKDFGMFLRIAIFGAIVFAVTAIIEGLNNYFEEKLRLKVDFDLNSKVFRHIQGFSLSFFKDKSTGEHIYKMSYDLERVTHMIVDALPRVIILFGRLIFILAMVFYLNWQMSLLAVAVSPFLYLQPYYFIRKRREIMQKQIDLSQSIFVRLEEVFSHMHLVKAFGKEGFEIRSFLERLLERLELSLRDIKVSLYSGLSGNGLRRIVLGVLSLFGGYLIIKGKMSLGSLTAMMIYFSQLVNLQSSLHGFFEQNSFDLLSCARIKDILDSKPDIVDKEDAVIVNFYGADIEFKDVTFGYQPSIPVLENLNFSIKNGSFIALVGLSGCGKTTLLNLLIRLYDAQKGQILISGNNIQDIKLDCLKSQIGEALQEPFLWNDTIANNIRYGKDGASLEEIKQAARLAQIHDFIESLPQGYETIIGEMASKISEGQKQRIAIARAVVKNHAILILDEAMSSIDSNTGQKIIENLKEKFKSSTVIVVSHRLSTVKNMDLVYFLEAADKMAIGNHPELWENNPKYRQLFNSQAEPEKSYPPSQNAAGVSS